jgi:hypothetical protein
MSARSIVMFIHQPQNVPVCLLHVLIGAPLKAERLTASAEDRLDGQRQTQNMMFLAFLDGVGDELGRQLGISHRS